MSDADTSKEPPIQELTTPRQQNATLRTSETGYKQTEAALRESEEQFHDLIAGSIQGILIHRNFTPLFVNQAWADIFGYESPDDILAMDTTLLLLAPHERDRLSQYNHARMHGEEAPTYYEYQGLRRDGSPIWLDCKTTKMVWRGQSAIQATIFDITDRKRAEETLKQAHHALEHRVTERTTDLQHMNQKLRAEVTERKRTEEALQYKNHLLRTLSHVQSAFILDIDPQVAFDTLLSDLLALTQSEFGFVGEVLYTVSGAPYLKTRAITNIAWDATTRAFYARHAPDGMEFFNLDTLFGAVMTTGEAVIANDPATDSRRGGMPQGHPPLQAFLGLPFYCGETLVGMVGIANRPGGYDQELVEFLQPFLSTCGNIIQARRNDQRRKQVEEALREREEQFRQMAENIHEVFWMSDPTKSRMIYISPAYEDIWGRSCQSLYETPTSWLDTIHPQDRQRGLAAFTKQCQGEHTEEEYRIIQPDGSIRWIRDRGFAIQDPTGKVYRITGIAEDITERKHLEEQLLQAQKMEAIGTLAGGIAHEFNNLLAAILGFTEMAAGALPHATPASQYLQEVLTAGTRAKDLVQQILTFSRARPQERQPVQLPLLVKETLTLLRASLPATITIRQHIAPDASTVLADPTHMHQILLNLCTNAAYAMRQTGGLLAIGVDPVEVDDAFAAAHAELQPGPYVRVTVHDTGPGIAPHVVERIFEPFFTTKGIGEGTGMGLAIVHGIVTNHGGAITVQSTPGTGTTFTIYLPRIAESTAPEAPLAAPLPHGQGCILFIDDEAMLARLGHATLERLGYEVIVHTNSLEALATFRAEPQRFDLVITDQTMPQMPGETLAEALRRIRPDIPIILCTGFSHIMHAEKARALGIDAFLMKPVGAQILGTTIQQVLASRQR